MATVLFTDDFDYRPTRSITIAYKSGWSGAVKKDCADKAIAANKAVNVPTPPRVARGGRE